MSELIVSRTDVEKVKAPEPTATWFPFPHYLVLNELDKAREEHMVMVTSERYELSKDGNKFFGVWSFGEEQIRTSIGFRNSIDRSLSLGMAAGTFVTVCSNLQFSGQWLQFRKHTKNILEDLHEFVQLAFSKSIVRARKDIKWQNDLELHPLTMEEWKILTYDIINRGVLAPSKASPLFDYVGERNLSVLFNLVTRELTQRSLIYTEESYSTLRFLIDTVIYGDYE